VRRARRRGRPGRRWRGCFELLQPVDQRVEVHTLDLALDYVDDGWAGSWAGRATPSRGGRSPVPTHEEHRPGGGHLFHVGTYAEQGGGPLHLNRADSQHGEELGGDTQVGRTLCRRCPPILWTTRCTSRERLVEYWAATRGLARRRPVTVRR